MSLILDALRKSEAERRRGQSPDLFSASNISSPVARPGLRWWPVAVFVVLLLASGWVIWDGRTQRALDEVAPASGMPEDASDANVEGAGPFGGDTAEADDAKGASEPAHAASAPPGAIQSAPPPVTAPVAPAVATAPATSPAALPPPATATPPPRTVTATAPLVANPRAAMPAFPPANPNPAPVAEPPAEEALPSLAVLDSITRGTLPPLKLSMHVWGQEPGKRFAIVDGQRVAEGSMLGNGVVELIRRDGVVINVNGQRLLLPKP